MARVFLPAILVILCAPAVALADAADDDTWWPDDDTSWPDDDTSLPDDDTTSGDDDAYTCNDVCARATQCGADCLPDNCLTYCDENIDQGILLCAQITDCADFNTCLCSSVQEDDESGDDNQNSGCTVSSGKPSFVLPIIMAAVGLLALVWSVRARRTSSSSRISR
jgi:hypothetical protein